MCDQNINMELGNSVNSLLPMLAMKDGVKGKDIRDIVKQLIFIDIGTRVVPFMIGRLANAIKMRALRKDRAKMDNVKDAPHKEASVQVHRLYEKGHENDTFDAIIWRLCDLPQTKHLKLAANGIYVLANKEVIPIDQDIYVKQTSITFDEKNEVKEAAIEIFSQGMDLMNLKAYMSDLVHKFELHRNNQLGQQLYYFDELAYTLPKVLGPNRKPQPNFDAAPKYMTFSMSKLNTNKTLDNVYGKAMEKVRKRVRFFVNNKKWYQDKGVPYTLGVLMYGKPGCGKTSLIKALSKDCQRHVFNIKLSDTTTVSQINSLFFNERVVVNADGVNTSYNIPIDKRLIVIEDIDCLSNVILQRSFDAAAEASSVPEPISIEPFDRGFGASSMYNLNHMENAASASQDHPQKLTLSYLLNVLDGVLETPGRILIITSNFPEKLDQALVRPGRIDLQVHFDKCTVSDIKDMIEKVTSIPVTFDDLGSLKDYTLTPAEVTQKIFENIDEGKDNIIEALKN